MRGSEEHEVSRICSGIEYLNLKNVAPSLFERSVATLKFHVYFIYSMKVVHYIQYIVGRIFRATYHALLRLLVKMWASGPHTSWRLQQRNIASELRFAVIFRDELFILISRVVLVEILPLQ